METLKISKEKAIDLFPGASAEMKQIFIETFGAKCFNIDIRDQVKTFEDACRVLRLEPKDVLPSNGSKDETAYCKLKVIIRALNEGWNPNWKDSRERKYYPWFEIKSSGSGFDFSGADFGYSGTGTDVGSRLCFKSSELTEYAGKQFISIYNEFLL